ncbi:peptidyl-prolyl cis-trans isomerase FKBP5-like [Dermacentor variabilis]|uniref:peptidyl-prolyl cis-trans isomerase FKBP5-like n=1 Tax=Dermacentor variabilis TaxID=34621 RepID=UPI003F5C3C42
MSRQALGGYGFGAQGCLPRIPPNATLVYEIALVDFTETEDDGGADIDSRLMPTNTLFGKCFREQRNGNRIYVHGRQRPRCGKLLRGGREVPGVGAGSDR